MPSRWTVIFHDLFADEFDPARQAVLLVAGDKAGQNQKVFYRKLIAVAEARYSQHLQENP